MGTPNPAAGGKGLAGRLTKSLHPHKHLLHTSETQALFSGCPWLQGRLPNSLGKDQSISGGRLLTPALLGLQTHLPRRLGPRCRRYWKRRLPLRPQRQKWGWSWFRGDAQSTGKWLDFGLELIGFRWVVAEAGKNNLRSSQGLKVTTPRSACLP